MSRAAGLLLLLGAGLVPSARATAQSRFGGEVRGLISIAGVERSQSGLVTQLDGTLIGLNGAVRFGIVELAGRYLQGSIEQERSGGAQDLVDGDLLLRVRPLRFLTVGVGPHARSYVEAGTERWLVWQARAGLTVWLVPNAVRGTLDVALGLGGTVNSGAEFGAARGVSGGLEVRFPRTPVYVGLAYSVDRLADAADARIDTAEQILVRVGVWP